MFPLKLIAFPQLLLSPFFFYFLNAVNLITFLFGIIYPFSSVFGCFHSSVTTWTGNVCGYILNFFLRCCRKLISSFWAVMCVGGHWLLWYCSCELCCSFIHCFIVSNPFLELIAFIYWLFPFEFHNLRIILNAIGIIVMTIYI